MTTLQKTWLATFTRRWHSNPDLCHTHDPVGAHSSRVALILWTIWPDSPRDLIIAALTHDLSESITGDIPPASKAMFPTFSMMEQHVAIAEGWHIELDDTDKARLQFADKLDAYMWAQHHGAAHGDEWDAAWEWLRYAGERMGITERMHS